MTVYKPSNEGLKAIANGPEIRAALRQVAEKAEAFAKAEAEEFRVSGDYADSFEVRDETVDWQGRYPGPRAAARLHNTSPHAAAVEWGNKGVTVYIDEATQRFVPASEADRAGVAEHVVDFPAHRILGHTLEYLDSGA